MINYIILLIGPIIAACVGVFYYYRVRKLITQGNKVTGEIVGIEGSGDDRHPIIQFTSITGQKIVKKSIVSAGSKTQVGDKVDIYHDSNDPTIFIQDSKFAKWIPLMLIVSGIIFAILVYIYLPKPK